MKIKPQLSVWMILCLLGCSGNTSRQNERDQPVNPIHVPQFNSDSAYSFIQKQVDFGPRVPNTRAHKQAGDYFIDRFKFYGAKVITQEFDALSYDGKRLFLRNIIASYNPERQKRILLAAHWDTRPFADKDPEDSNAPFDGANDGASGVGVLLEIARLLHSDSLPAVGVDMVLFDGEDWGEPSSVQGSKPPPEWETWWCLGSQYWSKNKHKSNYSAYYGILLDMVGAADAQFLREGVSLEYAPKIVDKIWNRAARIGYSNYFLKRNASAIIDDHVYVNKWGKIPMVTIVYYQPEVGYFGSSHHSRKDNMTLIDKETLEAVGRTVMDVLYYED